MTSNGKLFMYIDQNTVEIENSVFFLSVMYETRFSRWKEKNDVENKKKTKKNRTMKGQIYGSGDSMYIIISIYLYIYIYNNI